MSNVAVRVEGLGKRYRIGTAAERHDSLRDALTHAALAPFRNLAGLRRMSRFQGDEAEDVVWALRDLSFEISHGEVVGIVGRNGAGKSTFLKILSRITEPSAGRAQIHGRVGSLLEVGTGFHPELTGRENVFLNGSILGMDRGYIESKFDQIVDFSGVEKFIDTPVKRYSSGMYLRLAFAVAAHLEPEILIVDEVLAVGDAEFQKKCIGKMGEVAGDGRTVLFVSHNMGAIANLCTRGIFLRSGRVLADGPIDEVIRSYMDDSRLAAPTDLALHRERQGKGRVRFTGIRFEDEGGNPVEHGVAGQPLAVALNYEAASGAALQNCRISLAVYDPMGQALFNLSSELTTRDVLNLPPRGTIRCVIPRLPLSGGEYTLSPFFERNGEVEDWLQAAATLSVVDGDFYGTGRLYPVGWQGKGVLVPHSWDCDAA